MSPFNEFKAIILQNTEFKKFTYLFSDRHCYQIQLETTVQLKLSVQTMFKIIHSILMDTNAHKMFLNNFVLSLKFVIFVEVPITFLYT